MEALFTVGRSLFSFVAAIGILVFVHEFGHFLVAKVFGVKVERFSLGFGPELWGRQWGETYYRIAVLPLGGYVRMLVETPKDKIPEELRHRSLTHQPLRRRALIVAAGPISNFILAVVIYFLVFAVAGLPKITADVGAVVPDSPAASAGIKAGDRILAVNGQAIADWEQVTESISKTRNSPVEIRLKRGADILTVRVMPEIREIKTVLGETVKRPIIGVLPSDNIETEKTGLSGAAYSSLACTADKVKFTFVVLGKLITRAIPGNTLAGPVGIAHISGEVAKSGIIHYLMFLALLSVNLGIFNLLPIPILDGGHLLFYGIEGVRGKPINPEVMERIQTVCLFLLIALAVFVFYNDIFRLFNSGR